MRADGASDARAALQRPDYRRATTRAGTNYERGRHETRSVIRRVHADFRGYRGVGHVEADPRVTMLHTLVKTATVAGLLGLVVLHPKPFAKIVDAVLGTFTSAVRLS